MADQIYEVNRWRRRQFGPRIALLTAVYESGLQPCTSAHRVSAFRCRGAAGDEL